jgi:hypothetical protein
MPEDQTAPGSHAELMSAIEREWKLLMDVVEKLKQADKLTTRDSGGWSPKDNLAHLAEWLKILMDHHMDQRPAHEVIGVTPDVSKDWDDNVINALLFERNKGRAVEDVLAELSRAYGDLTRRLRAMSFEDLLRPRSEDEPGKQPILDWVLGNTTEHFAEHRETIEKLL